MRLRLALEDLKLGQKGFILVVFPIVFAFVFVGVLAYLLGQAEHDIQMESQSKEIVAEAHELTKAFYDAGQFGAVYGFNQSEAALKKFTDTMSTIPEQIHKLERDAEAFEPNEGHKSFEPVSVAAFNGMTALKTLKQKADMGDTRAFFSRDTRMALSQYVAEISKFIEHERQIADAVPQKKKESRQAVVYFLYGGLGASALIGLFMAIIFNVGTTKRVNILVENTFRLADRESLHPPITGKDEFAHIDKTFHDMATELDRVAKHKQELVSMVSHDLRTPLMSMQVSLELLSEGALGELPEVAHKELKVAEYSATRLIHLINDLLDVEKMNTGKLDLNCQETMLSVLFERAARSVKAYAERQEVTLNYPGEDCLDRIYADHERIVQVLINLLSNAIKFSPKGAEVRMEYDQTALFTEFRVIDHGRGVPAAFREKIFDRFQQVKATDATEKKGSGLGLAICKAIVDAHDGTLGVNSVEGQGSTFWFRIPKTQPA